MDNNQPTEPTDVDEQSGPSGSRTFTGIAALTFVIGIAIGAAFVIGLQVGRGQAETVEETPQLAITNDGSFIEFGGDDADDVEVEEAPFGPGAGNGDIPPEVLRQMREQGASEEDIALIRAQVQQFREGQGQGLGQGRPVFGAGTGGFGDAGIGTRMVGTIESIDGDTITLMMADGPQRFSTIAGTRITVTKAGGIDDLSVGDRVTIAAVPGPDPDVLEAASITSIAGNE